MTIWDFQDRLTKSLTIWAVGNILVGLVLLFTGSAFGRGFGEMMIGWGAINLAIALFGQRGSKRRRAAADGMDAAVMAKEQAKLARILWVNAGLDVAYMAAGYWLAQTRGAADPRMLGWGYAIILQGAFLFVFDLVNALLLRRPLAAARPQG